MNETTARFELMVDREPCDGPCDVCLVFEPLTPARLAAFGAAVRADQELARHHGRPAALAGMEKVDGDTTAA